MGAFSSNTWNVATTIRYITLWANILLVCQNSLKIQINEKIDMACT